LRDLANIADAELSAQAEEAAVFVDVQPLMQAGPKDVSFFENRRYLQAFRDTKAGACLVHPDFSGDAPDGMALLLTDEPYRAYARVAAAFYPPAPVKPGVSERAIVDDRAVIGAGARIDAGAVIGADVTIGNGVAVGPGAVIGAGVTIGDDSRIGANATLEKCVIGARVVLCAGARIGQDGFGFAPGAEGHLKVPQLGRVIIEDDVQVGANSCIDCGAGPDTVIGQGTKIDNLVQIGHNVVIGRGCLIAAQVGISGSSELGDFVMMGGQSGMAGHLKVGTGVRVAGQSGITRDIDPGLTIAGMPAVPAREHWRQMAALASLTKTRR